jgi:pimeloyl-ACP methyl ester carboxylesterase
VPVLQANGIQVHYQQRGAGPELVLIHGITSSLAMWYNFAAEKPDRVRGLVMMDSGVACLRYLRIIEDWWGWEGRPADMRATGLSLEEFLELDAQQDVTEIIRHSLSVPRRAGFRKGQPGLTPRLERLLDESKVGSEFREVAGLTEERLAGVATPVMALYGEKSPYSKMGAHLAKLMPLACDEVIPGIGHFYAIHKPALAVEKILPFLRDPEGFVKQRESGDATVRT